MDHSAGKHDVQCFPHHYIRSPDFSAVKVVSQQKIKQLFTRADSHLDTTELSGSNIFVITQQNCFIYKMSVKKVLKIKRCIWFKSSAFIWFNLEPRT